MEDRITLDQISTQAIYNLNELYNNEYDENDIIDSPYSTINNVCDYYEPHNVKNLLGEKNNSLSLFCLNSQGLRAHWDAFSGVIQSMNGNSGTGSFDIIGVTELYSMTQDECNLTGYHPLIYKTRNDSM